MEDTIDHLHSLLLATNGILMRMEPANFPGAINWGDLKCISAHLGVDRNADPTYQVVIDEAAPDESKFHEHIAQELAAYGWPGVQVITEW